MQAKDGMQARVIGTTEEAVRAKAKTGKGVVSPKNGKARTDRMTEAHQCGKARAARKAATKAALIALTKLVTLIGGRNETDHSTAHNPEEEIHFCTLRESNEENQRHEVDQKEDAERMDTTRIEERPKRAPSKKRCQHTTDMKRSALRRPGRGQYTCLTSRTMANGSGKRLSSTAVLLSVWRARRECRT